MMSSGANEEQISRELASYVGALLSPSAPITPDSSFDEMGIDSISLVKILVFIEKKFGISLSGARLGRDDIATFGSLVACISRHMKTS